ncbi:hypothetical protein [Methanohalobium sp.]|uniref:hypothetical protein n=1 Tax=Methanohalobium sp. TaxID=2837493 RepID=UPI0025E3E213|nr:hypothetical protein [Methanohalobium sp.]
MDVTPLPLEGRQYSLTMHLCLHHIVCARHQAILGWNLMIHKQPTEKRLISGSLFKATVH